VVGFDGGDPDRPIVLGGLYNGITPSPFPLPGDKTKSGLRTQSTPNAQGFNELSFQDAADREQVYLHAQRDHDEVVRRDHNVKIGRDEVLSVDREQRDRIGENRTTEVQHTDFLRSGSHEHEVRTKARVDVGEELSLKVGHDRSTVVGGNDRYEVHGLSTRTFEGDDIKRVIGSSATVVGTEEQQRSSFLHVEGPMQLRTSTDGTIMARKSLILWCGDSHIIMTPKRIVLHSPEIVLRTSQGTTGLWLDQERLIGWGDKSAAVKAGKVVIKSDDGASLGLTSEAKLDGRKIHLGKGATAKDPADIEFPDHTVIRIVDQDGNPIANQLYRMHLEDGSELLGFTGSAGASVDLIHGDGEAEIEFPGLHDVDLTGTQEEGSHKFRARQKQKKKKNADDDGGSQGR
jgi:type VI secretion system secreted protein VgrG